MEFQWGFTNFLPPLDGFESSSNASSQFYDDPWQVVSEELQSCLGRVLFHKAVKDGVNYVERWVEIEERME